MCSILHPKKGRNLSIVTWNHVIYWCFASFIEHYLTVWPMDIYRWTCCMTLWHKECLPNFGERAVCVSGLRSNPQSVPHQAGPGPILLCTCWHWDSVIMIIMSICISISILVSFHVLFHNDIQYYLRGSQKYQHLSECKKHIPSQTILLLKKCTHQHFSSE